MEGQALKTHQGTFTAPCGSQPEAHKPGLGRQLTGYRELDRSRQQRKKAYTFGLPVSLQKAGDIYPQEILIAVGNDRAFIGPAGVTRTRHFGVTSRHEKFSLEAFSPQRGGEI